MTHRHRFAVLSSLVCFATVLGMSRAASAQDSSEDTVGVAVAVAINVSALEADLLSDDLGRALAERFEVSVVSGEAARAKLPPDGLPETCIAEVECLGQTAAALSVRKLLLLVAVRVGADIQVDATLFDATTKLSENRPTVKMTDKRSDWKVAFDSAAESLLPGAKKRSTGNETGPGVGPGPGPGSVDSVRGGGSNLHVVLFGVAAASIAVGTASGVWALSHCDWEFGKSCDGDPVVREAIFDIGVGVGAALSVAAIIVMLKGDDDGDERAMTLQSGPGDVGFAIGGSF